MMTSLLGIALLAPVVAAAMLLVAPMRRVGVHLCAWAAFPALALAIVSMHEPAHIAVPWLLLGSQIGVDAVAVPFLLCTAILWLAAGIYAVGYLSRDPRQVRFLFFFAIAMSGNVGFIVAQDVVTAYASYTAMSLAGYGLVAHAGTSEAIKAGRLYIVMALVSEVAVLAGAVLAVAEARGVLELATISSAIGHSPSRDLIVALFFVGFGVKAGTLLLHVWLPPAHAHAPTPASAVLSGAIVKVGVLGWLRMLPSQAPEWGIVFIAFGLAGAVYAAVVGFTQRKPKAILAYSTVGQLGLIAAGVGTLLLRPAADALVLSLLGLFVVHHALVKGAMFLSVGMTQAAQSERGLRVLRIVLVVLALAIVGLPLTGGALAKAGLKSGVTDGLALAFTLSSAASAVLMARFLVAVWPRSTHNTHRATRAEWLAWGALSSLAVALPWLLAPSFLVAKVHSTSGFTSTTLPALGGALIAALVLWRSRVREIPTGDIAVLVGHLANQAARPIASAFRAEREESPPQHRFSTSKALVSFIEAALERWAVLVLAFVVVVALCLALLTLDGTR